MTISRGPVRPEGATSDEAEPHEQRTRVTRANGRFAALGLLGLLVASVADAQPAPQKPIAPKTSKPSPDGTGKVAPPKPPVAPPRDAKPKPGLPEKKAGPTPDKNDKKPAGTPEKDADKKPTEAPSRWTDDTPEKMAGLGIARARAGGADALAGLLVAAALDERVTKDEVLRQVAGIGRANLAISDDARMLSLLMSPLPFGAAWDGWAKATFDTPPSRNGLVQGFAILGPFQDTGGGLQRHEGPEADKQSFADGAADYSWGVYKVGWRRVLPQTVTAEGLPLDL